MYAIGLPPDVVTRTPMMATISCSGSYSQSWNGYVYVLNSPLLLIDAVGRMMPDDVCPDDGTGGGWR